MTPGPGAASFFHRANALTYTSLLLGIGALATAVAGSLHAAGGLVAAAAIADTFDGRWARSFTRTPAQSAIGVQLDSLVDTATFAIVPVACTGLLLADVSGVRLLAWWSAAFVYAACAVTRLGVYNVCHAASESFVGLPVPIAALFWSTLMLLDGADASGAILMATGTGLAMVSPVRIPRPSGVGLALFLIWPVALVVAHGIQVP